MNFLKVSSKFEHHQTSNLNGFKNEIRVKFIKGLWVNQWPNFNKLHYCILYLDYTIGILSRYDGVRHCRLNFLDSVDDIGDRYLDGRRLSNSGDLISALRNLSPIYILGIRSSFDSIQLFPI